MATLYDISNELQTLLNNGFTSEFVNEDGEIDFEKVTERLENLQMAFIDKVDDIASYIKDLSADADKIEAEANALKERAAKLRKRRDYLSEYVCKMGSTVEYKKIETTRNSISFIKTKKTEIVNELLLPEEYVKRTVTTAPDKTAILKALKEGKEVEGAKIVENVTLKLK